MHTRIVECQLKPGKKDELTNRLNREVLPLLQAQPGFVDVIALSDEKDPDQTVSISIWKTKEEAERHHQQNFQKIMDILGPALKKEPTIRHFNVETSTAHRIAAGRAA
jgi:quinol monooxygenase YgiN